jgi:5-deoxy-glucuronate isomerase
MVKHVTLQYGYNSLVEQGEMQYIELGVFKGKAGDTLTWNTEDCEAVLVFLSGRCRLRVNGEQHPVVGGRRSVFEGNAWSLYAPNGTQVEIEVLDEAEVAVSQTRVTIDAMPKLIPPEEVNVRDVGVWNWRRDVKDIVDKRTPAARLLVGETINPPGNWSSWPPHKHDVHDPPRECKMEEVYLFKVQPSSSFGLGRLYTADGTIDEPFVIRDNTVLRIPKGYHPIAAAPGTRVYYLWVLAGEQRDLIPNDAPEFRWQKDTEAVIREMQRHR